eukprot:SAG11_NODE_11192_length_777_cov_2.389381_1_plen_103_part_10
MDVVPLDTAAVRREVSARIKLETAQTSAEAAEERRRKLAEEQDVKLEAKQKAAEDLVEQIEREGFELRQQELERRLNFTRAARPGGQPPAVGRGRLALSLRQP